MPRGKFLKVARRQLRAYIQEILRITNVGFILVCVYRRVRNCVAFMLWRRGEVVITYAAGTEDAGLNPARL
jgi:hypothetical protein